MKRLDSSEVVFKIIAYVAITIFAVAALYPFIYTVSVSISGKAAVDAGAIVLFPKEIQLKAFEEVFNIKLDMSSNSLRFIYRKEHGYLL